MKRNKGITMISLMVTIVILMILATITMYYGNSAMKEAKLQDLKTNMLLIQASLKSGLEKYHFETSNLSDANEKEAQKSNYLKGTKLADTDLQKIKQEIFDEIKEDYPQIDGNFDYYYLSTSDLMELGIKDVESSNEDGHYIVAYSMNSVYPNIVEVINTKGYLGNYTLSRIQAL